MAWDFLCAGTGQGVWPQQNVNDPARNALSRGLRVILVLFQLAARPVNKQWSSEGPDIGLDRPEYYRVMRFGYTAVYEPGSPALERYLHTYAKGRMAAFWFFERLSGF